MFVGKLLELSGVTNGRMDGHYQIIRVDGYYFRSKTNKGSCQKWANFHYRMYFKRFIIFQNLIWYFI